MSPYALAEALEATRLEPVAEATEEEAERMLEARAPLLEALLEASRAALPSAERERLAAAVEALRAHDAALLEVLEARRSDAERASRELADARGLARAYRSAPVESAGTVLRRA